jgi:hypothetical protein
MNKKSLTAKEVINSLQSAADIKSIEIVNEYADDNCLCFDVKFNKIPTVIEFSYYDFGTSEHFRLFFKRKESQKIVMQCIKNVRQSLEDED